MKNQNAERQKPGFPKEYVENADLYKLVRTYSSKRPKNFTSLPFLSVLHQNKALHNFCKRVKCSIVEHNMSLEHAPPVLNEIMTRRK